MKHTRRLVTMIIVLAMVLTMSITAFAAADGTIKIVNTAVDATYTVYKVFDATYSGENVSYTYNGSNQTFLTALQADNSPFAVTKNATNSYNIVEKAEATDDAIINFIKDNATNLGTAVATENGDGNDITINGLAYGYYYITTTTGTVVTIDNAMKDAVVIDKNEKLAIPSKTQSVDNGTTYTDTAVTANVGDTIKYKITGNLTRYNSTTLVTDLVFTDTMTDGLAVVQDVAVKIDGVTKTAGTDYTVTYNATGFTITLTTATVSNNVITYNYDVGDAYEITYSATVDADTITDGTETNTINLKYNTNQNVGDDTVTVNNYDIILTKTNKTNSVLAGAEFKLYDAATEGNNIPVVLVSGTGDATSTVDNVYRHAVSNETGVTMVTGTTGKIVVQGLANGDYYFEETKQPEGYNILTARTEAVTINNADGSISVVNETGSVLPSTGGIGTTIFYILGGILAVGALIVLITNKRMRAH